MVSQPRPANGEAGPRPVATYLLIAAQVIAWLVVRRYLLQGSAWTELALRPGTPSDVGLLVSPFIHLEAPHLGVNLVALWLIGSNLERAIGTLRFTVLYLGSAWFASLMQWAVYASFHVVPDLAAEGAAVGASGAVAGVLGASMVRFPQARLRLPVLRGATFYAANVIVMWAVYTVARALLSTMTGLSEGIGHWAHLAGFIFGLGTAQLAGLHRIARAEHLERAAREAAAQQDLRGAVQAWTALLGMNPANLEVRAALIGTRARLGDQPGARRLAREGIQALVKADERQSAVEAYRAFTLLVPELTLPSGIRYRIGCWLADALQDQDAFRALWESVREDGASPAAAGALYRAGQLAWERLRSPEHAREAWERLLEQFPDSAWTDAARDGLSRL